MIGHTWKICFRENRDLLSSLPDAARSLAEKGNIDHYKYYLKTCRCWCDVAHHKQSMNNNSYYHHSTCTFLENYVEPFCQAIGLEGKQVHKPDKRFIHGLWLVKAAESCFHYHSMWPAYAIFAWKLAMFLLFCCMNLLLPHLIKGIKHLSACIMEL